MMSRASGHHPERISPHGGHQSFSCPSRLSADPSYAITGVKVSFFFVMSAILVLDLGHVNWGAVRYKDEVYDWTLQAKTGLDSTIGKDRELFRVGSFEFGMGPNIEMVMEYQTVGGYTPFFLHRYYEYINFYADGHLPEGWVYFFYGRHPRTRLMDLLNLKYEILYDQGSYTIRNTCLPRAFLVPDHELVERSKVLNRLIQPGLRPHDNGPV